MKRLILFLFLMVAPVVSGVSLTCPFQAVAAPSKQIKTAVFKTHLHCANCVKKVEENIAFLKGVKDLKVSLSEQTVTVSFDASKTSSEVLATEIVKLGYPVQLMEETGANGGKSKK